MVILRQELVSDQDAIEQLLDLCFGADRFNKASYQFRQGVPCLEPLSLVAEGTGGEILGTIRYWPVALGSAEALLLGPIAVHPALHGRGVGRALVFTSLTNADTLGFEIIFLVGDPTYYARFGFSKTPAHITMPNEDPQRLQYRLLGLAELPQTTTVLQPKMKSAA